MNGLRKTRRCGSGFSLVRKSWSVRTTGFLLAASSCSFGYSRKKSPCPIVLFTSAMEWHIMQPSPACASGRCTICLIGVSISPAYSTAGSWHPPHHFEGLVPTVSCMYSIDLRYHWLLNDEKWCAELNHWL